MITLHGPRIVPEHKASAATALIYHDIKQTLRVTGVSLNFCAWAGYPRFFSAMWEALRANASTRAFEDASDRIRAETVSAAAGMERLKAREDVTLGESQSYQVRGALLLYHYLNPKLLLFTSSVISALRGEEKSAKGPGPIALIERGAPAKMAPMELVDERPSDHSLRDLFKDIRRTMGQPAVNSDYRTLALWPDYLRACWQRLRPRLETESFQKEALRLERLSAELARELPHPALIARKDIEEEGEDVEEILAMTQDFQRMLPALALNIALFSLDWFPVEELRKSPFPAAAAAEN